MTLLHLAIQSPDKSSRLPAEVLPWLIVLVGVVLVGGIVIYFVRRSLWAERSSSDGFTLEDLRQLHAAGELTDEQFNRAKAMMIGRLREPAKSSAQPSKPESQPGNHEQSFN